MKSVFIAIAFNDFGCGLFFFSSLDRRVLVRHFEITWYRKGNLSDRFNDLMEIYFDTVLQNGTDLSLEKSSMIIPRKGRKYQIR